MIDSHCHLDDARLDADRDEVMQRARAAGVERIVVPGVSHAQWDRLGPLAARFPEVRVAVGIHPESLRALSAEALGAALEALGATARSLGVCAIGEVGLDGNVARDGVDYPVQTRVLDAHLELARSRGLPVILHVLRAHGLALEVLRRHAPLRGVVHSYSGPAELVPEYVRLGLHLSFAGGLTRRRANKPFLAARAVPQDRLLVETDAPDQAPSGAGTERNEPHLLTHIVAALALARETTVEAVAAQTAENARALFGL